MEEHSLRRHSACGGEKQEQLEAVRTSLPCAFN